MTRTIDLDALFASVSAAIGHGKARGAFEVEQIDKGLRRVREQLEIISRDHSYAKAGVMGKKAVADRPTEEGSEERLTNVKLALIHEFGAPAKGIPERSFIRRPFDKHREEYLSLLSRLIKAAVYEGRGSYEKALRILGLKMATDMKLFVTEGREVRPPNSPATFRRKLAKGYWKIAKRAAAARQGKPVMHGPIEAPRPLIDTGRLVGSLTWGVVKR